MGSRHSDGRESGSDEQSQAPMGSRHHLRGQRQGVKGLRLVLSRTIQALLISRQAL